MLLVHRLLADFERVCDLLPRPALPAGVAALDRRSAHCVFRNGWADGRRTAKSETPGPTVGALRSPKRLDRRSAHCVVRNAWTDGQTTLTSMRWTLLLAYPRLFQIGASGWT